ncbi:hypothetical protein OsI_29525 [Oryza sativa Indica Group]|jgi:hypothetical protein|uniref:Uncharacterized protein n=1 Tax=Oryza sativa subsp. indica TaxID=39946 RepID=B8BBJ2_ORYSI|nr:hypothetical protein OsI_29525 [Oryza sativa Indica Group]
MAPVARLVAGGCAGPEGGGSGWRWFNSAVAEALDSWREAAVQRWASGGGGRGLWRMEAGRREPREGLWEFVGRGPDALMARAGLEFGNY